MRNKPRPAGHIKPAEAGAVPEETLARREFRRQRRIDKVLLCACLFLIAIGLLAVGWPTMMAAVTDHNQSATASQTSVLAADASEKLAKAEAYNAKLAQGQGVIGEASDPFGNPDGDFSFENDKEYQSTLDMGGGIMGVLKIPKISLELPIRHGASDQVLRNGVGHLHGTSLPVGGDNTHAVLTGHRGLQGATLFTRLDELKEGDPIYVETMGRTVAYQVDRIYPSLTPAEATKHLRITKGEDRLTLMTCTPVFVNTHRLLVSAKRAAMPGAVDYPDQTQGDTKSWLARYWQSFLFIPPLIGFVVACAWPARGRSVHKHKA